MSLNTEHTVRSVGPVHGRFQHICQSMFIVLLKIHDGSKHVQQELMRGLTIHKALSLLCLGTDMLQIITDWNHNILHCMLKKSLLTLWCPCSLCPSHLPKAQCWFVHLPSHLHPRLVPAALGPFGTLRLRWCLCSPLPAGTWNKMN